MNKNVATKIRELINEQSLSVQGLEKKAGLKVNAVRNILTGHSKKPSAENLLAVAKALNCSLSELLGEDGIDNKKPFTEIEFYEHDLLSEITTLIIEEFKKKKVPLQSTELIQLVQEIYTYSCDNNNKVIDIRFAKWLINKHLG